MVARYVTAGAALGEMIDDDHGHIDINRTVGSCGPLFRMAALDLLMPPNHQSGIWKARGAIHVETLDMARSDYVIEGLEGIATTATRE